MTGSGIAALRGTAMVLYSDLRGEQILHCSRLSFWSRGHFCCSFTFTAKCHQHPLISEVSWCVLSSFWLSLSSYLLNVSMDHL